MRPPNLLRLLLCLGEFGATFAGRYLVVSYTERGDSIRVISARAMTPRERKAYED